ncbi:MAG: DUF3575 domain-containing protein [Ignavibacteriae bacterium]|nr:DUF3575 domain-containing protein [Ignavibacteriota bacterium]
MNTKLILISILIAISVNAQTVTKEKKETVNTETGDTVYTESTTISTTEDITPRENMIVINPLKFFFFYNISYFHKMSDKVALGGGFQIPTLGGLGGIGVNTELRYYPSAKTLRGFYFAPNISYNNFTVTNDDGFSTFSIGALVGWQWFPGDDFAIGLGIGIDYYTASVDRYDNDFSNYSGTLPAIRFDIGYAW